MAEKPCEECEQGQEMPDCSAMVVHGRQTIKHPWFSGLKAVLDFFCENVELQKKVRIVVEYDPQKETTELTYYWVKR